MSSRHEFRWSDAVAFQQLATDAMRTGDRWENYARSLADARKTKWYGHYFGQSAGYQSPESLKRQWAYVYRFDPLPALAAVKCPVLGLFGEVDTATPGRVSADNMRRMLNTAGNKDVTVLVIPSANHPLMEARTGGNLEKATLTRMAPQVFPALREWILRQTAR